MRFKSKGWFVQVCVCMLLAACGSAGDREAEQAYKSLKGLQGQTQAGMNYPTYSSELGKTIGVVSLYLERGDRDSRLYKSLAGAMENYVEATEAWDIKISRSNEVGVSSHLSTEDERAAELLNGLDEDYQWTEDGTAAYVSIDGEPVFFQSDLHNFGETIYLDEVIKIHWALASVHLAEAGEELK